MKYLEDINTFFEKKFGENFNNENPPFKNGLEKAIFCLVQDILKKENGAFFVEVPMRELGAKDHAANYSAFCGAIAFASALSTYENNKNNKQPEIENMEYFYDRKIFIRRGSYKLPFDDYGTRNEHNTTLPIVTPLQKPKLLSPDKFIYNNKNGTNKVKDFFTWANTIDENPLILNNITQMTLVISHGEIDNSKWMEKIPHCTITDDGKEIYSSPIEPLIYLARDKNEKVIQLVESKAFDTIIFIGDAKFYDGGLWSLRRGYFKRKIYIGGNNMPDDVENFYCFSPTEIQQYYGGEITDGNFEFIQANSESLENKFAALIECFNKNKNNVGIFSFSLLPLLNRTAPIDIEFKEQLLEWFDNKIMSTLSFSDHENLSEELTKAYIDILDALSNGNESKLKELDSIIKKNDIKKVIIIVNHRDEIDYFSKKYAIDKNRIVTLNSFSKKIKKHAYSNSDNKRNVYIFLAYKAIYDECLQMLDSFSLNGKRIFIGLKDNRFERMLNARRKMINSFLSRQCIEDYTGIKFQSEYINEDLKGADKLSINDFLFDDEYDFVVQKNQKLVTYSVTLEDDSKVVLSGTVEVENSISDIDDLSVGDTFTYYTPQIEIFNAIFNRLYPNLNDEIEQCSKYWINALKEIYVQEFKKKIKPMYEKFMEYGWKTHEGTLKLYLSDRNNVQFPQSSSLRALKKYCDQINSIDFNECSEFKNHYNEVRKAQKAQSSKNKLGRLLSRNLLEEKIGNNKAEFIKTIGEELWFDLKNNCLKTGTVKDIKKTKD
jgi:hypothetical protein